MNDIKQFLEHIAYQLRVNSILATSQAGSGHPTTCLSAADLVAATFFYAMHMDPKNHENPNNDRFILSKGHAAPLLYAVWKELGVISQQELMTLRQFDSVFEGHPTPRFKYNEAATGSLGQGLSIGAGMAYAALMDKRPYITYVLLGDSELSEGSVWEAVEISAFYKLKNLVGIVDVNRLGQSTPTMEGWHTDRYAKKFRAFGWNTILVDGHDMGQVMQAFDEAKELRETTDKPTMIIAKTVKGYGVVNAEDKGGFHGKPFPQDEVHDIVAKLHDRFASAAQYHSSFTWKPQLPEESKPQKKCASITLPEPSYKKGESIATRKVYGQALTEVGRVCEMVVSLDAEVKNSTYAELFEKVFPKRFIQCFIAEQNMVGMGVGFAGRGHIPFISTFACFLTRAFDQIRMAAIGRAPLRLVGSHAGVSIGADGPSQMGLEDIAMMRAVPNSVVLYPSDAVSTYKLVEQMANYHDGISYLRTTRMATPVIYDNNESFPIGGCKVVRQSGNDKACIIAAGVTLVEALKAYDRLKEQGISVAVIDLYSIKPLDYDTILGVAKKAGKKVVTVEDHYLDGGLGEAVSYALRNDDMTIECLAVKELSRSGTPAQLLAYHKIDAAAIIDAVQGIGN